MKLKTTRSVTPEKSMINNENHLEEDKSITLTLPSTITLVSYDGIHSGVPTRTTSTLTPTTLRNIEQTFMELSSEPLTSIPCQAGFVPPLAPFAFDNEHSRSSDGESLSNESWATPPPSTAEDFNSSTSINSGGSTSSAPRRNMGGRRPARQSNLTPEEEEKRKVRRERNKLAAARCRKRRVDHTNELMDEVEGLEKKKENLQTEIQQLQHEKEDLEFVLDTHRAHCRLQGGRGSPNDMKPVNNINKTSSILPLLEKVKSEPIDPTDPPSPKRIMLSGQNNDLVTPTSATAPTPIGLLTARPNRPNFLNVPLSINPQLNIMRTSGAEFSAIPIQTPSSGMFNFDSLMDGGTGLTPISAPLQPTCSTQSQNRNPLELTTPTSEPSKLVSL